MAAGVLPESFSSINNKGAFIKMTLNVAFSCNENYFKHAMVSILSLIDNNKDFDSIHIYLICDNVSVESKNTLCQLIESSQTEITLIDLEEIKNKIHTDGEFPVIAFGRLFLGEFVPDDDRIIYLDCDSVVNGSFMPLI